MFRLAAVYVVFLGAQMDFSLVWDLADVLMGGMVLINLPVICRLSGTVLAALRDYTRQKTQGKDPVFRAADIGLKGQTDFWK